MALRVHFGLSIDMNLATQQICKKGQARGSVGMGSCC
jgi:hypothetical protein